MGVFLSQLPPAELTRLKAELAEALIANFCYPRFFDYRTNSLRMRPVDRSKRQEVWLYLSSVDLSAWGRVDLMSPDFQRQVERLFIHFVQRNRSFFGEQGRKRMSDVRMLLSSSALLVIEGLRGHLMGRQPTTPPFGTPRPVLSWATTNGSGYFEPNWDQIVSTTMLLQQQLQEVRGEIRASSVNDGQLLPAPVPTPVRRTSRVRPVEHAANGTEQEVSQSHRVSISNTLPPVGVRGATPPSIPKRTAPLVAPASATAAPATRSFAPTVSGTEFVAPPVQPFVPQTPVTASALATPGWQPSTPGQVQPFPPAVSVQSPGFPQASQAPSTGIATSQTRSVAPSVSEDVAIFEQMRHQLVVWLRIEAVRLGMDISGLAPLQLLELLRQQNSFDETRLQIVSTLLNLANQVIKNGQANLLDYKQGLMFYLIHTQR